jgi:hypothetical protein
MIMHRMAIKLWVISEYILRQLTIAQLCYLDILDNLPRLRLSSSQLKMILWVMKECGAKDVPSFNAFRSMQLHIRRTTGVRSEAHKSDLGNLFYVNDVRDLIAKVSDILRSDCGCRTEEHFTHPHPSWGFAFARTFPIQK